jgi:hypothetical protein
VQTGLGTHQTTPEILTDALTFMAAGTLLARAITLLARERSAGRWWAAAGRAGGRVACRPEDHYAI